MLKCFPVLISIVFLLSMLSFHVAAQNTESESFSFEETSLVIDTTSESLLMLDEQEAIINRLDLIYTLGLFFVAFFAGLLVLFMLWRVLYVFI